MSDFISNFWSVYITAITLGGIVACAILLWATSRKKVAASADNTTGHVWDEDLREMNNPLPMWWVGLFIITIVFAAVYLVFYPGLGNAAGKFGWSSKGQYENEIAKGQQAIEPLYARFNGMPPEQVAGDAQAMAIGERLFKLFDE